MPRRKALLIGINYTGSSHQLNGCINDALNMREYLVRDKGFPSDPGSMVMLTDAPQNRGTPYEPTGANMMAAFHWLVTGNSPGDSVWLSYSGHGGQVRDPDGDRDSGYDDTIYPLDFERHGQISSDTLHRVIVSPMHPQARLTILFDCCHSGSAVELPYVYRPDSAGQVNLVDNVKKGMSLVAAAANLVQGGFTMNKVNDAKMLLGGARSFFAGLQHRDAGPTNEDGLGEEKFVEDWKGEHKDVWMFSGCADDQTSADTSIAGAATGAMSWAFIRTMRENPQQSYINVLQNTRQVLRQKYEQIPQLSVGAQYDLDQVVSF
ncbi:hypothetical protein B0A49_00332 [Cryomyces minteri]|uniref:Peptidase C14 caspase domain-containing protein n=1 Tax=Cryomyces minteri TaxID=331657 RepID=A0A4U0XSB4_9PEZI|nr:hypothetical protein B0A49_00332 [Cryomyces minteri]